MECVSRCTERVYIIDVSGYVANVTTPPVGDRQISVDGAEEKLGWKSHYYPGPHLQKRCPGQQLRAPA